MILEKNVRSLGKNAFPGKKIAWATRQYHADMHPGQEAERRDVFQGFVGASDFAHVIGATWPHCKKTDKSSSSHRSGVLPLAKNNLSREGQRLMPLIEHTIHLLRVAPPAFIFRTLASLLFETLLSQQPPERVALQKLQSTYFMKVHAAAARQQYQVLSCRGGADHIWLAVGRSRENLGMTQIKDFFCTSIPTLAQIL